MKRNKLKAAINCLLASITITIAAMAGNFLIMLFSSGEDGRRTCFFDALYFNSVTEADESVSITFGLTGNLQPILVSIVAIFCFLFVTYSIFVKLEAYQKKVIEERKGQKTNE